MHIKNLTAKVAAGAAATVAGLALTAGAAGAAATAGTATIAPTSGGSHTSFNLTLPAGAACSGDTANGGYKVFSFLVPASTNVANLTYSGQGPSSGPGTAGVTTFPLYPPAAAGGSDFTAKATNPGDGRVVGVPAFDFDAFSADGATGDAYNTLPNGDYIAGIACATNTGAGDKFWSVPLTFTNKAGDINSQGFAVTAATPPPAVPEVGLATLLPLSAVGLLAGGTVVLRRRRKA